MSHSTPECVRRLALVLLAVQLFAAAMADTLPPVDAFARMPAMRNVAISPDGQQLLFITGVDDLEIAATLPISLEGSPKFIFPSQPGKYDLTWCGWANNQRVLCGVSATVRKGAIFDVSRLIGVNADGTHRTVLFQSSDIGNPQFQDEILDWTPGEPDTVLMQLDVELGTYPGVYAVNVNTGSRELRSRHYFPIRSFATDGAGNVRFGYGSAGRNSSVLEYFARLDNEKEWLPLAKINAFSREDTLIPVAIIPGTNRAFATGNYEGRQALWEMDLTDQAEPKLVFSHPHVDVAEAVLTPDHKLIGIRYETDRPFVYYTDPATRALIDGVDKALPGTFNHISEYSQDRRLHIVQATSDVARTYYLLRSGSDKLYRVGTAYPELDPQKLGRMNSISYAARDGVEIPGYLTVPPGVRAEQLPLIVMPHKGPMSRDSWEFDFLRAFLVSRGYAVLQMNFRGSSGYGRDWYFAAHQDWGGVTYDDITDGTKWAIERGIADSKRVCIVGWDFGGYAALLSAVRNGDLYRCSASIAGVSDLNELLIRARHFVDTAFVRAQLGTSKEKLIQDSPVRHVDKINMPVLLIHGERDTHVDVAHSRRMAAALKKAGKPYQAIILKGAGHELGRKSDRVTLLKELEKFVLQNLGPGKIGPQ